MLLLIHHTSINEMTLYRYSASSFGYCAPTQEAYDLFQQGVKCGVGSEIGNAIAAFRVRDDLLGITDGELASLLETAEEELTAAIEQSCPAS